MSQPARGKRRWQFTLGSLLLAITAGSLMLSGFYPRVHAVVHVQVAGLGSVATHERLVRSNLVLSQVVDRHPAIAHFMTGNPVSWLTRHISARAVTNSVVEIRMSGAPKDHWKLQQAVQAVSAEYIAFLKSTHRDHLQESLAIYQQSYDALQANDPANEGLRQSLAERIANTQSQLSKNPPPVSPKIVNQDVNWGW